MSTIVVHAFITLDGIVQAGGGPDEDREGGFAHGGWATEYDEQMDNLGEGGTLVEQWESGTEALLLGRKTYEIWAGAWGVWDENAEGLPGELTRRYNRIPKYVASQTLTTLGWKNSHLLGADVPAAVKKLRAAPGGEIRVWGSTQLIRTLAEHDLIDLSARGLPYRARHRKEAVRRGVRARQTHPGRDRCSAIWSRGQRLPAL